MRRISSDSGEMPFLDHLEELRWRIIWSLLAIVVAIGASFFIVRRFDLIGRVQGPILPYLHGRHLVATDPTDGLRYTIKAALWLGGALSFPVVLYQAWLFLSPALFKREKQLLMAVLGGGVALFVAGALFAYAVVLPLMLPVLFDFLGTLEPMITAEKYFDFVFSMALSFGLAFELPVVVLALAAAGLVSPQLLSRYRRHAVVAIVVASAFLTPGDVVTSMIALAVPLYLLYELSVVVAWVIWRRRKSGDESVAILIAPILLVAGRWRVNRGGARSGAAGLRFSHTQS